MRKTGASAWKRGAEHSRQLAMGREYLSTQSPRSNHDELFAYGHVQGGADWCINQYVRNKQRQACSSTSYSIFIVTMPRSSFSHPI